MMTMMMMRLAAGKSVYKMADFLASGTLNLIVTRARLMHNLPPSTTSRQPRMCSTTENGVALLHNRSYRSCTDHQSPRDLP